MVLRGFAGGRKRKTFKVSKIIKAFTVSKLLALQKLRHQIQEYNTLFYKGVKIHYIYNRGEKDTTK